mgnify:CR=1 FL=1
MGAPKNNKFWQLREKHGRDQIYSDPKELLDECYKYFKYCDENPWNKMDAIRSGKNVGEPIAIPTQRPYTLAGMCVYLGIVKQTWHNMKEKKDFIDVITHVEEVIETNQLEGATVGVYNHNIVARLLGLKERTVNENIEQPLFPDQKKSE